MKMDDNYNEGFPSIEKVVKVVRDDVHGGLREKDPKQCLKRWKVNRWRVSNWSILLCMSLSLFRDAPCRCRFQDD